MYFVSILTTVNLLSHYVAIHIHRHSKMPGRERAGAAHRVAVSSQRVPEDARQFAGAKGHVRVLAREGAHRLLQEGERLVYVIGLCHCYPCSSWDT